MGTRRLLGILAIVLTGLLLGCAEVVDQAKQEITEAARQEAQNQLDQARENAKDAVQDTVDSAKGAVGIPKSVEPDMNHAAYTTTTNPFYSFSGHCTWFAWGRAFEKWGARLPMTGHAGTWYTDKRGADLVHSAEPRADAIAVWQKGDLGHVAYVEKVDGDTLLINEANWIDASFGQHGSGYTGSTTSVKVTAMATRYGKLLGYIYVPMP